MPPPARSRPDAPIPSARERDADICAAIAAGDLTGAFAQVMARYRDKVYRLCFVYLRSAEAAEDTAQESLVRVWRTLPNYDGRAALSTLIYTITRNRCLTALGRQRDTLSLSDAETQARADGVADSDAQGARDRDRTLRQLVDELPETTRRIVTLYYFEDESVAETAALTGLPEGTVKTHLFRARASLLSRLEGLGLADPGDWLS